MLYLGAIRPPNSLSVSKIESNYPAHKLEFPALKWAVCDKFHEYYMVQRLLINTLTTTS